MTDIKDMMTVLLLASLLPGGVRCQKEAVFVYSILGGEALLPCTKLVATDCSAVTWTFFKVKYTEVVSGGRVNADSDRAGRMTVTSNCSVIIRDLGVEDAGSYACLHQQQVFTDVYLSLLTITSASSVTELQPGGNLVLSCILFTYFDAGSCKAYSSGVFGLRWQKEDRTLLPDDTRYQLIENTRCNITLVTKLQTEDNNRRWRCQVNVTEHSRAAFLDFKSSFLFQNTPAAQTPKPAVHTECSFQLPISRIVLVVTLPLMLCVVGFFTWRADQKRAKTSAAAFELQEVR
ncbi:uncharacterized protein PAE49_010390 [Odontesthes bonariensis]|uniref:uncharacterized protein LOC142388755 n=1 Tax=Odontesthes bonariensis TaxID=219752 RepID=UPI003F58A69F